MIIFMTIEDFEGVLSWDPRSGFSPLLSDYLGDCRSPGAIMQRRGTAWPASLCVASGAFSACTKLRVAPPKTSY